MSNLDNQLPEGYENAPASVKKAYIERQHAANAKSTAPTQPAAATTGTFSTLALLFDILIFLTIGGLAYMIIMLDLPSSTITLMTITNIPALLTYYTIAKLCRAQS